MDFLIKNGNVYDPARGVIEKRDIALHGGLIAVPEAGREYRQVVDASGCIVTAGLIDYHVHYFNRGAENSVNPDAGSFCCGITTAVDGGSCGAGGYELYRRVMVMSDVRILSDLLVASGGQSNDRYPENLDPAYFDEGKILELFERYPDNLVGLKTRISKSIISPKDAAKSLKHTIEIAEKAKTRVVVHVTDCSLPLAELADMLRPGDVMCHIYHSRGENTCLDENKKVHEGLFKARERGVIIDASNGRSNYDINVCKTALEQGFTPDIISSDINSGSFFLHPLHSSPRILSKYLDLGMSLEAVLDTVTIAPARLINRPELGSMSAGTPSDVCIFKLEQKPIKHEDIAGNTFIGSQILMPMMTFKDGKCMYCRADFC